MALRISVILSPWPQKKALQTRFPVLFDMTCNVFSVFSHCFSYNHQLRPNVPKYFSRRIYSRIFELFPKDFAWKYDFSYYPDLDVTFVLIIDGNWNTHQSQDSSAGNVLLVKSHLNRVDRPHNFFIRKFGILTDERCLPHHTHKKD